jgi:hypothetical protein
MPAARLRSAFLFPGTPGLRGASPSKYLGWLGPGSQAEALPEPSHAINADLERKRQLTSTPAAPPLQGGPRPLFKAITRLTEYHIFCPITQPRIPTSIEIEQRCDRPVGASEAGVPVPHIPRPASRIAPQLECGAASHIVPLACQPGPQLGGCGFEEGGQSGVALGGQLVWVQKQNRVSSDLRAGQGRGSLLRGGTLVGALTAAPPTPNPRT